MTGVISTTKATTSLTGPPFPHVLPQAVSSASVPLFCLLYLPHSHHQLQASITSLATGLFPSESHAVPMPGSPLSGPLHIQLPPASSRETFGDHPLHFQL